MQKADITGCCQQQQEAVHKLETSARELHLKTDAEVLNKLQ
jgi:hypothetical protein